MRRRSAFPKAGDRIMLALPPRPRNEESSQRYGTVLERSCGRSGALRVRWDGPGPVVENWLPDASWHWARSHLRVVGPGRRGLPGERASASARLPLDGIDGIDGIDGAGSGPAWPVEDTRTHPAFPRTSPPGTHDAAAEWEAALDELGPGTDDDWEEMLAAALGTAPPSRRRAPASAPAAALAPAPVAAQPAASRSSVATAPPPAAAPRVPAPAPRPAPVPPPPAQVAAPPTAAPAPRPPVVWAGDDILPGASKRRGRH